MSKHVHKKIPKVDVHRYDQAIEAGKRLAKSRMSKNNYSLLEEYDKKLQRDSFSKATRLKHIKTIDNLTNFCTDTDWKTITRKQIQEILTRIMETYSADSGKETYTTYDHKKILKLFVRYVLTGKRELDAHRGELELLWDVNMKRVSSNLVKEDMIDEDDMEKLSLACGTDIMFRALLWVAFDAGTRPGEILTLTVKSVRQSHDGWTITVDGKTGQRIIHLVKSVPHLAQWLNCHPYRDEPNWPLWVYTNNQYFGRPISYNRINHHLKQIQKRSGVKKRLFLNIMRHSEVTLTSKFMPEALLKKRHGWSATSKVPANYQHLVQDDVKDVLFEHYGVKTETRKEPKADQRCQNCNQSNGLGVLVCNFCHLPVSLEAFVEIQKQKEQEIVDAMAKVDLASENKIKELFNLEKQKMLSELRKGSQ